jgi:DNA-binding transcriptional regulator YiaG
MTPREFKILQFRAKISNKDLAELLEVHVNTVSYWKSGYRRITPSMEKFITMVIEKYIREKEDE